VTESLDEEFTAFVAETVHALLRAAYALTGDQRAAEDLVQTALAKAFSRWRRISGEPEPYVRRIIYHDFVSSWRRRRRRGELPMAELPERPAGGSIDQDTAVRLPHWYEHRCLWTDNHDVTLHVFGPDCDEYLRHLILRDWLRSHPDDQDLYAARKHQVAAQHPLSMAQYVSGKADVIIDILKRAGRP
jgi:hypothetical protein